MRTFPHHSRFLILLLLLPLSTVRGQVGSNNPTGPAGMFNGNVTTGCSYDPFTGNATRTITDIVVAGAVGQYGLSYSRTWNSRSPGWGNSFGWGIADVFDLPNGQPIPYAVTFPDGRTETFTFPAQSGNLRIPGVAECVKPLSAGFCYLILPDGGKVEFKATQTSWIDYEAIPHVTYYSYAFETQAIIDPYGQRTTFTTNTDGSFQVTEPGGRWIKFFYTTGGQVDYVQASDGRIVDYTYTTAAVSPGTVPYTLLTSVTYYGDSSLVASYNYQAPNVGTANGTPLLKTSDDPMYDGPMKKISYTYATANNPNGTPAVYGQILSESGGTPSQAVSTLTVNNATTRTETRGDGKTRTFTYNTSGFLTGATDFKNANQTQTYDAKWYVNAVTDRRGNTTNYTNNTLTGTITLIQHPTTPSDTPAGTRSTKSYVYGWASCPDVNNRDTNNPYYLYSQADERGNSIIYARDTTKRVIQITYPDTSTETFVYNIFGQVTRKKLKNGSYQHASYTTAGLLWKLWNPTTSATAVESEPKTVIDYYPDGNVWEDRLWKVTDARNNVTTYEYERDGTGQAIKGRGLVSKIINPDLTYKTFGYDSAGNRLWEENEKRERINYTYDDYRRVTELKDPLNHAWQIQYLAPSGSSYVQTAKATRKIISPEGIVSGQTFDDNLRIVSRIDGEGTAIAATTAYEYDGNGNRTKITDPRSKETTTAYDARNRQSSSTFVPLSQTTQWLYDPTGNVATLTRPDTTTVVNTYDQFNRLLTSKDSENRVTTYTYWPSGKLKSIKDPKNQTTQFEYSSADLRTKMISPNADYESWSYDSAFNMTDRRAVNAQTQHYVYDNRNRPTAMSWSNSLDWANYSYDDASRLTSANNANSNVTLAYNAAGRLSTDTQNVAGSNTFAVSYQRNNDGRVRQIDIPSTYNLIIGYDEMGRVKTLTDQTRPNMIEYAYDAASNVTQRTNYLINSSLDLPRDDAGRVSHRDVKLWGSTVSSETYGYDLLNRLLSVDRTEDNRRDLFGYDLSGQITSAQYGLVGGVNPLRAVTYSLDGAGNRSSVIDGGVTKSYVANNLNQYTTGDSAGVTNGASHEIQTYQGLTYTYLNDRQLSSVTGNGNTYSLGQDALGRTVKRTLNSSATYYFYDGQNPIVERGAVVASNVFGPGTDEILIRFMLTDINYFYQDQLGSVTHVVSNNTGQVVETYRYDAFGTPTIRNGAGTVLTSSGINNRFMFTGREYAPGNLGFYEYRARAYHPTLGRFMQPDPIGFKGDSINIYRYCGNDPINHNDPSGLGPVRWGKWLNSNEVVVRGNSIPTAETSGMGPEQSYSSINSGNDASVGNAGGGGGHRLREAADWLERKHPELKVRQHRARESWLPPIYKGYYIPGIVILIDPDQNPSMKEYVTTYAHELMHANESLLDWLTPGSHDQIVFDSETIGMEWLADTGH